MIRINNKNITAIYLSKKVVTAVYEGLKLIWQNIQSCFGSGGWHNHQGWDNNDGWNNG